MKRMLATAVAVAAAFGLAACSSSGGAPPPTNSGTAPTAGASSAPAGSATIYGALASDDATGLKNGFHKAFPNENITFVTAGTGKLVTRMEAEKKAGGVKADAMFLADPTVMAQLTTDGIVGNYMPAAASSLPSNEKGPNWFAPLNFYNVIVYHTGLTPVPTDWSSLGNSAYKGKVEIGDPGYSGTTLAMAAEAPKLAGNDFFQKLKANDVKIVESTSTVGKDVASGAEQIGVTLDSVYRPMKKKGEAVNVVWPSSGAIGVPADVAMVKGNTNPVAENFLNWLLTPDCQQLLLSLGYSPVLDLSKAVPSGSKTVILPYAQLSSQRSTILANFTKVLG